tara:strand:+ start:1203 stop:1967 length:765 start_codon:yes stop_codon:yes gene_type:complete
LKQFYDPVAVTLLTGFLGSGKTTLVNSLVSDPRMADTAVIINEFGSIAIDHDLVRAGSERYMRTTTGCLCCSASSDIRTSLFELHDARMKGAIGPISRVVIETTGLADPAPIINSLIPGGAPATALRDHAVARHFYLQGVITAFDTIDGRATLASFIEGWKQLAFADAVILTKTDIAEEKRNWAQELSVLIPPRAFVTGMRRASTSARFSAKRPTPLCTRLKTSMAGWRWSGSPLIPNTTTTPIAMATRSRRLP